MNRRGYVSVGGKEEAVRIWLLGGFRVAIGARPIEKDAWRLRKSAALIKLLALATGHRLHREQVMNLLWPELGKKAASNSLRNTLHAARKVLDQADGSRFLASEDDSLVCKCRRDPLRPVRARFSGSSLQLHLCGRPCQTLLSMRIPV